MKNKYGNKQIIIDGEKFDSMKEYKRWCELRLMQRTGMIKNLERQVKYVLIPAQYKNGKCVERECAYFADFVYKDKSGNEVVEDVKGYRDPNSAGYAKFVIKRKMMLYFHGIRISEV